MNRYYKKINEITNREAKKYWKRMHVSYLKHKIRKLLVLLVLKWAYQLIYHVIHFSMASVL